MKRMITMFLLGCLLLNVTACGNDSKSFVAETEGAVGEVSEENQETAKAEGKTPADFKKFKIGVAEMQANDEGILGHDYYERYIAPHYNVEFIFSEQITDSEKLLTFIENCADAGCDAVISTKNDDIEQMTQVCQEYGMKYVVNTIRIDPKTEMSFSGGYNNFAAFGTNQPPLAEAFSDWLKENASEDGSEGFLLCSGWAYSGTQIHIEIITACLKALQDIYGLTYEGEIDALVTSSAPIEVVNDKGINIYIYPGNPARVDGFLQGLTAVLQTGNYGVMLQAVQLIDQTGVIVEETEKAIDKDIKVVGVASVSESLHTAFATKDQFGNASVDMVIAKPVSLIYGSGFVQTYNLLTGYENSTRDPNGDAAEFNSSLWPINDLETLDTIIQWDVLGGDKWIADYEIIDNMLGIYHPEITNVDMQAIVDSVNYESTVDRLGNN